MEHTLNIVCLVSEAQVISPTALEPDGYHSTVVFLEGLLGVRGAGVFTHSHVQSLDNHQRVLSLFFSPKVSFGLGVPNIIDRRALPEFMDLILRGKTVLVANPQHRTCCQLQSTHRKKNRQKGWRPSVYDSVAAVNWAGGRLLAIGQEELTAFVQSINSSAELLEANAEQRLGRNFASLSANRRRIRGVDGSTGGARLTSAKRWEDEGLNVLNTWGS